MRRFPLSALLLALLAIQAAAAPRAWRSNDGRTVNGEFVSRDASSVTIRLGDRREVAIGFNRLHAEEINWLDRNHPLPASSENPPAGAIFDSLIFGDSRSTVLEKLTNSKFVESTASDVFLGRTGLNGIFRTRGKVGGLDAFLYFGWTDAGGLESVTLQTESLPESRFDSTLKPAWQEFIPLLTQLYGKPVNANPRIDPDAVPDGEMSGTHLWRIEDNGNALLGPARAGDKLQIVVRFTRERIEPVPLPAALSP